MPAQQAQQEGVATGQELRGSIELFCTHQEKGRCLLDALQHALLRQVVGPVVVPYFEPQALELEIYGICLVAPCALCMAVAGKDK